MVVWPTGCAESTSRSGRSSEALLELKDPRIGFVTVTGVDTSPDLRQAVVFVSVLGGEKKRTRSMIGLDAAHGVLQSRISRELRLKRTHAHLRIRSRGRARRADVKLIDELAPEPDPAEGRDDAG